MKTVINVKNLCKTFHPKSKISINILSNNSAQKVEALKDISFKVYKGESFGIIGMNGAGKSTLISILMNTILPNRNSCVEIKGTVMRLSLGLGIDNNLTARDNVYVNGSILGIPFSEIGKQFDEIIQFAGVEKFVDTEVKYFSKGMKQRLFFSIAVYAEADIFLLDEFFGGTGDIEFKIKSDKVFKERIIKGKTNVIVSHSMDTIKKYCNRVLWLENGALKMIGDSEQVVDLYNSQISSKI